MRPFQSRELQHAILGMELEAHESLFDEDALVLKEALPSVCAGLVGIDEEADVVHLAHYTAGEYFVRARCFPTAANDITRACIRYLSLANFAEGPCPNTAIRDRLLTFPFATYAALYWRDHAMQGEDCTYFRSPNGLFQLLLKLQEYKMFYSPDAYPRGEH